MGRRLSRILFLVAAICLAMASAPTVPGHAAGEVIEAVVVKSWGGCSPPSLIWDSLNATWQDYGDVPIHIDYSYPGLCDYGPVTYRTLLESGADVVIVSDPSGNPWQWSQDEVRALDRYVRAGHTVIGTYLLLSSGGYDNRALAPIFGLPATPSYSNQEVTPTYNVLEPSNPLFAGLPDPYVSVGYNKSQTPSDGSWDAGDLTGARYVGMTDDSAAAILVYERTSYTAVYVTSMPEFNGGTQDHQFFYNAITYREG
jgi:hypothetical protein